MGQGGSACTMPTTRSPGRAGKVPASLRGVEMLRPPSRLGLMASGLSHHTQAPPSSDPANPWL